MTTKSRPGLGEEVARPGLTAPRRPAGEAPELGHRREQETAGAAVSSSASAAPAGLLIVVYGLSAPQGSKRARAIYKGRGTAKRFTGKVSVQESSKAVKPWREAVKAAALDLIHNCPHDSLTGGIEGQRWRCDVCRAVINGEGRTLVAATPMLGPLRVTFTFTFPRPKFHYRTGRFAHLLRDSAPPYPDVYPDTSKLVRSTEDALTDAGVWRDDAQAVDEHARKVYPGTHPDALDRPGAVIRIQPAVLP